MSLADNLALLTPLFFVVAVCYSMVGFGGGSSYIALLIFMGVTYTLAPSIALICNIIVVAGGTFHFIRNGHLSLRFLAPFVLASIPLAFLGGLIPISKTMFQLILGITLLVAAIRMFLFRKKDFSYSDHAEKPPLLASALIGAILGFVSGLVGIGGGIFLAPLLYLFKWGTPKRIAATASAFIFLNSISGLLGQVQKVGDLEGYLSYWPLMASVLVGGQVGSWLCNKKISHRHVEIFTGILVFIVSARLIINASSAL